MSEGFKIESISAFISVDENGEEGILAQKIGGSWMPFIMADETRLLEMKPLAESIAQKQPQPIKLVRFTHRVDVETLNGKSS